MSLENVGFPCIYCGECDGIYLIDSGYNGHEQYEVYDADPVYCLDCGVIYASVEVYRDYLVYLLDGSNNRIPAPTKYMEGFPK